MTDLLGMVQSLGGRGSRRAAWSMRKPTSRLGGSLALPSGSLNKHEFFDVKHHMTKVVPGFSLVLGLVNALAIQESNGFAHLGCRRMPSEGGQVHLIDSLRCGLRRIGQQPIRPV